MDDISFILNELGEDRGHYYNAISPPIIQTSNFRVNKVDELKKLFEESRERIEIFANRFSA
jgi:hypothetical protein